MRIMIIRIKFHKIIKGLQPYEEKILPINDIIIKILLSMNCSKSHYTNNFNFLKSWISIYFWMRNWCVSFIVMLQVKTHSHFYVRYFSVVCRLDLLIDTVPFRNRIPDDISTIYRTSILSLFLILRSRSDLRYPIKYRGI
jgi:hypothetical protein